jgi:outer membrane protein assembly factor BamB
MCAAVLTSTRIGAAQEWTRFRGPNGSGVSQATTVPAKWTADDFRWSVALPGQGHGSPVAWGNRLFLNAEENAGGRRLVVCLDTSSGKQLWSRAFESATHKKHLKNSYASSTPAVDEERVYVAWAVPERLTLKALDHEGRDVWDLDLGPFKGGHGFAASPVVYGDLVVLANDQEAASSLVAVDRRSGQIRWKVPRRTSRTTYSTPCVFERPGRPPELIFTEWQQGITAVDPQTGKTNWQISVFDVESTERAIGSPVIAGDLVIGSCGFVTAQKHVVAVRPGESGKPDDVAEVYRLERAGTVPHIPTPLVHNQRLYLWSDKGIVSCHDAADGRQIWQQRIGGNFFGSPVCVASRLYCVSDAGEVVVLAAADEFAELGRYALDETCHSTPAVSGGTMFIRTASRLHAVGGPRAK